MNSSSLPSPSFRTSESDGGGSLMKLVAIVVVVLLCVGLVGWLMSRSGCGRSKKHHHHHNPPTPTPTPHATQQAPPAFQHSQQAPPAFQHSQQAPPAMMQPSQAPAMMQSGPAMLQPNEGDSLMNGTGRFSNGATVMFFGENCGHCTAAKPAMLRAMASMPGSLVVLVDAAKFQPVLKKFGVTGIPHIVYIKGGKILKTYSGDRSEASFKDFIKGVLMNTVDRMPSDPFQ